jgi:stage II sporulation protein D
VLTRGIFSVILLFLLLTASSGTTLFRLPAEPLIRVGLSTNSSSVTITTNDSSLVSFAPDEAMKTLGANRITVTARVYHPPEVDEFRIEFQNYQTQAEANEVAKDIREATGQTALVSIDTTTGLWKVWVGPVQDSSEEAELLKAQIAEKGFDDAIVVTDKKVVPSADAVALSQQLKTAGRSDVRSLVKTTSASGPNLSPDSVNPNLREVIVTGASETAKFTSLKTLAFGSINERFNPVKINGKAYRGKVEVFVNSRGTLSVVNVVPLEDYLLGVVPSELGLPQLEAEKAQAVAARTYAVANLNGFGDKGFDLLPTIWSQVYQGVSIETPMGTRAVNETRGIVATYDGKPINALYTSTCGGRTENSENIFDKAEPYLRGVECSLEAHRYFEPFTIRTVRSPAKLREDGNLELVRLMSILAVNGFQLSTGEMKDDWFEGAPTESELSNWLNQIAVRFGKTFPNVSRDSAKPVELARILVGLLYPPRYSDTLFSDSDVSYQLSFDDAAEIPKEGRADVAALLRDGYFTLHPDLTLKPQKPFSRAQMLHLIQQIFEKKKFMPQLQTGVANPTADGKLNLKSGKNSRSLTVRPDVFLFRQFGGEMYPVREATLIGGENVAFQLDPTGAVSYLEIKPTDLPTTAESMSPHTLWNVTLSSATVQARLSRYVRGIGTLYDVNVKQRGYSRRAIELEIVGSNGTKSLKGGKIRSALRLKEQLFVINKKYAGGQVASYTFTGRGWGHGVGMCQFGAYGLAKMGVKYDEILKHYYTGIDLAKAY